MSIGAYYKKIDTLIHTTSRSFEDLQLLRHCGVTDVISSIYIPVKIENAATFRDLFNWLLNYEVERCARAGLHCHPIIGIHPLMAPDDQKVLDQALNILEDMVRSRKDQIVGIGETGLENPKGSSSTGQFIALKRHLEIAKTYNLPVVIKTPTTQKSDLTKIFIQEIRKHKVDKALITQVTDENVQEILLDSRSDIKIGLSIQKGFLSIKDVITLYKKFSYENRFTLSSVAGSDNSDLLYMVKAVEAFESAGFSPRVIQKLCFDNAVDIFGGILRGKSSMEF